MTGRCEPFSTGPERTHVRLPLPRCHRQDHPRSRGRWGLRSGRTVDEHGLRQQRRQFPIPVGEDGRYTACDVPTETPLTLRAELGAEVSGFVETTVPTGGLRWRDFGIGISDSVVNVVMDSTAGAGNIAVKVRRGEARLSGTVRTAGMVLGGLGLVVLALMLGSTIGLPDWVTTLLERMVITWPGVLEVVTGRWMLIDV